MMLARQTGPRHLGQDLADDAAQRFLGENVVSDVILSHGAVKESAMAAISAGQGY